MIPTTNSLEEKAKTSGGSHQKSGPLFVVGMWRSGTSLLYALLNQHPDIGLMYEDDLPLLWPMFIGGRAKRDWLARWEFWNSAPQRHKIEVKGLREARPSLRDALEFAYKRAGTGIWGTKSPNYYDSMTSLAKEFPDARFLIIWRELGGICSSVIRAGSKPSWFSRMGMTHRTILGYQQMKLQREQLVKAQTPVHEIQYENLISDPETTMKGICEFLQIPFVPQMCSLQNADRSAVFEHDHHAMVKSSKIVAAQSRADVVPLSVKKKIARYSRLWRVQFEGKWPPYKDDGSDQGKPSWLERSMDRLIYRALKIYDLGIVFLYCYGPISLLQSYRSMKRQAVPAKGQKVQEAA